MTAEQAENQLRAELGRLLRGAGSLLPLLSTDDDGDAVRGGAEQQVVVMAALRHAAVVQEAARRVAACGGSAERVVAAAAGGAGGVHGSAGSAGAQLLLGALSPAGALTRAQAAVLALLAARGLPLRAYLAALGAPVDAALGQPLLADLTALALRRPPTSRTLTVAAAAAVAELTPRAAEAGPRGAMGAEALWACGDAGLLAAWCEGDSAATLASSRALQLAQVGAALLAAHAGEEAELGAALGRYPLHLAAELACLAVVAGGSGGAGCPGAPGSGPAHPSAAQSALIAGLLESPVAGALWTAPAALAAEVARFSAPLAACLVAGFAAALSGPDGSAHRPAWGALLNHLVNKGDPLAAYAHAAAAKFG
eukprot:jgi/Tetstr1/446774/TSEL_034261.t1